MYGASLSMSMMTALSWGTTLTGTCAYLLDHVNVIVVPSPSLLLPLLLPLLRESVTRIFLMPGKVGLAGGFGQHHLDSQPLLDLLAGLPLLLTLLLSGLEVGLGLALTSWVASRDRTICFLLFPSLWGKLGAEVPVLKHCQIHQEFFDSVMILASTWTFFDEAILFLSHYATQKRRSRGGGAIARINFEQWRSQGFSCRQPNPVTKIYWNRGWS